MPSRSRTAPLIVFALIVASGTRGLGGERPPLLAPPPAPALEQTPGERGVTIGSLLPFVRDTELTVHLRTFYFDGTQHTGTENEAWAGGGWLRYESGWLADTFAMGATLYGSGPLYAPEDKDGTFLLAPGQKGYYVPGEAWGVLRYRDYALLKGYRQSVDQGYINPSDIRMTPYTFEGATVGGQANGVQYLAGYLWRIKPRDSDTFVSMAEKAGATGSNDGVALVGVEFKPSSGVVLHVDEQYGVDTFNTLYAKAIGRYPLTDDWAIGLGAEFTDQRAAGAALVDNTAVKQWDTQVGGTRVQLSHRALTITGAFSVTASGNTIQNPWGTYPGFLALIDAPASQNFARANEKGWLIGACYDFSALGVQGFAPNLNFARGTGAIDPKTGASAPDQNEFNLKFDYRPPWLARTVLRGLVLTVRTALYMQGDSQRLARQIHLILNWDWDIVAPAPGKAGVE